MNDVPCNANTVTLVEDATHVSEGAIIATALETLHVDVQCGIAGGNAVCTEQISDADSTTTIIEVKGFHLSLPGEDSIFKVFSRPS